MPIGRFLAALFAAMPMLALADTAVPDTPAGKALGAWLEAINTPDRARQEAFIKAYPSFGSLQDLVDWRAGVGGYELLEIYPSVPANVFFRVKQKSWPVEEAGRLQVSAGGPADIRVLGVWRVRPGETFEPYALDESARARVVDSVAAAYQDSYIDAAIGREVSATLRSRQARGDYRALTYGDALAETVTRELAQITRDKHASLRFSYFLKPTGSPAQLAEAESRQLAAINCEFEKTEHLASNVGYIKFNGFANPAICRPTATAAFTALADSDALVIDLRENHGGSGEMAMFIASYLFANPAHLTDTFTRDAKVPQQGWTLAQVPGKKFVDKPVFLLTSRRTFSAGEGVSYALQALRRATVIGETTAGGGHMVGERVIDAHFTVRVPDRRVISPITKAGFEGRGVEPDVKVPAEQALEVALKLATDSIRKKPSK